jgi:hypothetical protein
MAAAQSSTIRSCSELSYGDEIEAWRFGKLLHRGTVNQTLPSVEMFWIICSRSGTRKLVDMEAAAILRIPAAAGDARPATRPPPSSTWRESSKSGRNMCQRVQPDTVGATQKANHGQVPEGNGNLRYPASQERAGDNVQC